MDVNSLKRLILTVVSAVGLVVCHKFGVSTNVLGMVTGLLGVYLAQSGANSALEKFAKSKAGQVLGTIEGAVEEAKADAALSQGQAVAAPGSPSGASGS